jgi:hypothetical protein
VTQVLRGFGGSACVGRGICANAVVASGTTLEVSGVMTDPDQALAQMLQQHEALRARMDVCEHMADELDQGRGSVGTLGREIAQLRVAFEAHNRFEERVLPALLHAADAFGEARISHMLADHVHEHRVLRTRLDGPTAELRATLYELRAHLAMEERYFLSSRVVRNDLVSVEDAG